MYSVAIDRPNVGLGNMMRKGHVIIVMNLRHVSSLKQ